MTHLTDQQVRDAVEEIEQLDKHTHGMVAPIDCSQCIALGQARNRLEKMAPDLAADLQEARALVHKWNAEMSRILVGSEYYNNPALYVKRFNDQSELVKQMAKERNQARDALSEANAKVEQLVGDVHATAQDYTNEHKECERLRELLRRELETIGVLATFFGEMNGLMPHKHFVEAVEILGERRAEIRSALSTGDAKE